MLALTVIAIVICCFVLAAIISYVVMACLVNGSLGIRDAVDWLSELPARSRRAQRALMEAELDRKQDEVRRTILQLAEALGMEAHEARRALIRESYLTSGKLPPRE